MNGRNIGTRNLARGILSRMTFMNDFEDIAKREEIVRRLRSRVTWLR